MEPRVYYIVFRRCVEWLLRILIVGSLTWIFSVIFPFHLLKIFITITAVYIVIECTVALINESFACNFSSNLFDALYDLDFKDYVYSVKEIIHNNGKTYYYPMVKATKHFPLYFIRERKETEDVQHYWLNSCPGEPKNTKEEAIFSIEKYKEQEIRINGNKIKEVNIINLIYE